MTRSRELLGAVLAGAASGGRAGTGVAALTLTAPDHAVRQPDRTLRHPLVRAAVGLGAAVEYVGDKLPSAPSRFEPAGLGARVATGAACGAIIARRNRGAGTVACAGLAAATAVGTAWAGTRWRAWAAPKFGGDLPGAVLEDCVVVGLAATAAALTR